jgi:hypothetical protein
LCHHVVSRRKSHRRYRTPRRESGRRRRQRGQ